MSRTQEDWINEYKAKNAFWEHDGNPRRPHVILDSGQHSNGFFNSRLVIPDEVLLKQAACDLLQYFTQECGGIEGVDGVVGPSTGATKLAELMSKQVTAITRNECFSASSAKYEETDEVVFTKKSAERISDSHILLCEDVLTTGSSVNLTAKAASKKGGIVLPYILVLVNRSGLTALNGKKIVALISRPMPRWHPDGCPLCDEKSEAIPAKDNWDRLNAPY